MPTALSANTGPAAATSVSILGTGLLTATGVTFGAVGAGTGLAVVSDSQLTVTCPAHGAFGGASFDTVDCTVTTAGGTSISLGAPTQYTYYDVPTVTSLAPTSGAVGTDTTVTTPGGTSTPGRGTAYYTYLAAPAVGSLNPSSGPALGGTTVTITGSGLTYAEEVGFGSVPVPFTAVSDTQIIAVAPGGVPGPVTVVVSTPAGTTSGIPYQYVT
ncbi:IPT/TIG domain-containing protein [Streptomyces sp. NBC_00390]|uniref:IPT/TIG domain-containing protein n=1 Tax=Streptomyces sp. NBC_00390 TaxID=2975736 RepID=UPI002E1AF08F